MCFIKIDIIPLSDIVIYEFEHWKRNHDFFCIRYMLILNVIVNIVILLVA